MLEAYLVEREQRALVTARVANDEHCCPLLLNYLSEGGANVLYRIVAVGDTPFSSSNAVDVSNALLRLRKAKSANVDVATRQAAFVSTFAPLFPSENIVDQVLVDVDASILEAVNRHLRSLDASGNRPVLRIGDVVAVDEVHAQLVQDMGHLKHHLLLEFKPKWLSQSPDAPQNAVRCRTCALGARRRHLKSATPAFPYCPLALNTRHCDTDTDRAARAILSANGYGYLADRAGHLAGLLATRAAPIFERLKELQTICDDGGVLEMSWLVDPRHKTTSNTANMTSTSEPQKLQHLSTAMTLRDCTLFIRSHDITFNPDTTELRLADFDLKTADSTRLDKWQQIERELIDEGWYTTSDSNSICQLRQRP